jgi:hypothetical protein
MVFTVSTATSARRSVVSTSDVPYPSFVSTRRPRPCERLHVRRSSRDPSLSGFTQMTMSEIVPAAALRQLRSSTPARLSLLPNGDDVTHLLHQADAFEDAPLL